MRPAQGLGGGQGKLEIWGAPLENNILVDIALDNNTFIRSFTGEAEVNYSGKDMRVLPWLSLRAQRSMNK